MTTPICDFVRSYKSVTKGRFHMPGHKGESVLGFEGMDITEISGADSLYEASGIIHESEKNASELFGVPTFYSTEGSSLAIRAMLYLAVKGKTRLKILAGRNAHRAFMYSAALLDFEISWLRSDSYLSCRISPCEIESAIIREKPDAVYITSPDYLGNIADIKGISAVCKNCGIPLLVDNAHGAYLKFCSPGLHPMELGADMCASSAHKTLPVVTGGAYLQVTPEYADGAKQALELFGSTSPSYLILQSLDACNPYLEKLPALLSSFIPQVRLLKSELVHAGYTFTGDEETKLTIEAKKYGYTGKELAAILEAQNLFTEFSDNDYLVLMLSPMNTACELERLKSALLSIKRRTPISVSAPVPVARLCEMSPRKALFSRTENISVSKASGRILSSACVGCPPAVPIVCCGEIIDDDAVNAFIYYGIEEVTVVAESY